jgi:XRE family transcriptional regulator, regulator of sulfur utilization
MPRRPSSHSKVDPPAPGNAIGGDPAAADDALGPRIAENLRSLRKERDFSLDRLAQTSGVSRAALAQIEAGRMHPTLGLLWKVSVGLDVAFHRLLQESSSKEPRVLRAGQSLALRSTDGRMESRLACPVRANPGLDVYELRFLPKAVHRSEPHGKSTTEIVILLTGAMRLSVRDEVHDLRTGDTIFFRADAPHGYENPSDQETRCINIVRYAVDENVE